MAEHWMYVPMAGFWWSLAELLPRQDHPWPRLRRPAMLKPIGAVVAVWLLVLLGMSAERNLDWRTSQDIFRATLEDNAESTMVHFNLALTYEGPLQNTPGARRHYQQMLRVFDEWREQGRHSGYRPEEVEALYSLANMAFVDREYFVAARYYEQIVNEVPVTGEVQSIVARAAFQLGQIYLQAGQRDGALEYLKRAVTLDPFLQSELPRLGVRLQ
jgi:tetratricopeptide (TPR) repeat protein